MSILFKDDVCKFEKNGTSALGNHLKIYCSESPVYEGKNKKKDMKNQFVLSFKKSGESGASSLEAHSFS